MARGRATVDLSLRVTRPSQARLLATRFQPLAPLLLRWAEDNEDSPVSSLWLEFDLESGLSTVPIACAGLRRRVEPGWVASVLLPGLHGKPLTRRQRELVELCCEAIPEGARLLYAFSLLPRGAGEVRLEILGLDPPGVIRYLRRTASHAVEPVAEALPLLADAERLHVSLDIGEQVSPRVGLEGSFRRLPHREPRWGQLFDSLVARDFCSPEKRDAALAWPGSDSFWTAPATWPAGARGTGISCVRSLSHLKLVCAAGQRPEAKVYLLLTPFRRPPRRDPSATAR
ncbi:MAG: hypothetical protein WAM82_11540 [Thermoanaerobaculia bacterium]